MGAAVETFVFPVAPRGRQPKTPDNETHFTMNVPNQLTIARIVMIFVFLFLANVEKTRYLHVSAAMEHGCAVAAYIIAILAGITDFLDGYIARKYDLVTDFGKLMDPLADKVFITATSIMMVEKEFIPGWTAVIIISREFLVTGLRLLAASKGVVMAADKTGKLKTVLQMTMLAIAGAAWIKLIDLNPFRTAWDLFITAIVILTVYSGAGYFIRYRSLYLDTDLKGGA